MSTHIDIPLPDALVPHPSDPRALHVDVGHLDFGHVDLRHVDLSHVDVNHVDIPLHIDLGHGDIPLPHVDIRHTDAPPPPHVDAAPLHVDIGYNHWWQNWPKTHAYVAKKMFFATTVDEIARAVRTAEADGIPLRAVGGGWSFSDAALPGNVALTLASQPSTGRPNVQTSDAIDQFLPLAEGFPLDDQPSIASIDPNNDWLIGYDQNNTRLLGGAVPNVPKLEANLTPPQPQPAYLINTRSLKSTLQVRLKDILSAAALTRTASSSPGGQKFYFHVEAGITMEELSPLLDSQSPRLQLGASGGNPGATLAGSLSTATHGAEINSPLLIDRVKAIHLVGPGGQQWWIEGNDSIADPNKLLGVYTGLDSAHIISGTKAVNGLLPQDWLNAVVVSMGCMGVIYSVVLEVFPLASAQEVTTQTTWFNFLGFVKAQNPALQNLSTTQILAALRTSFDPLHSTVNAGIASAVMNGSLTNGVIPAGRNTYGDLAFNPNPAPPSSQSPAPGDCDCWVVNRQVGPVAFDPQPPGSQGIASVVNSVFRQLGKAFGGDPAKLALRLADVYGIGNAFHIDVPVPHIDIALPHIDVSPHVDIATPHLDVSEHIDVSSPPISATEHIDIAPGFLHADVSGSVLHADMSGGPLHIDTSIFGNHIDISEHIDISTHIDVSSPPLNFTEHVDIAGGLLHADVSGSALHADIASEHLSALGHIDVMPHIDLGHIDLNGFLQGLVEGAANPLAILLSGVLGFVAPDVALILQGLLLAGFDVASLVAMITTIANAHDTLDVALGTLAAPMSKANAVDLAQPFLTGVLASTLGTSNDAGVGISIGTQVGSVGFPNTGLLGAGIEIALPLETAFGFLQTEILDKMDPSKPFFGYVSVRLTPGTTTLLGMQQWPLSVMIEVVSFGDDWGKGFVSQLQSTALAFIQQGNDAMLHWGLENDQMNGKHLNSIPALQQPVVAFAGQPPLSKLSAFKLVRSLLINNNGLNPPNLFRTFDNSFTARLNLQ